MPVGPIGSVWAEDTWADTTWELGSWGDAEDAVELPEMTRARGVLVTAASSAVDVRVQRPASATRVLVS
jgi:hypothetical protein